MNKYPVISSISVRSKIVLGTFLVAFIFCAIIVTYSQSISNVLLEETAKRVFQSSSNDINSMLQRNYGPVERATSMLAYSTFNELDDINDPLQFVPSFSEFLADLPTATAIQIGSKDGDFFILRYLPEKAMRDRFNAPDKALFVADHLNGITREHKRYFYDDKVKNIGVDELEATEYDPRVRPWYTAAIKTDHSITTSPYVFYFLKEIGITIGKSNESKTLVVATDITLSDIANSLKQNPITQSSASLIHIAGDIIAWSGDVSPLIKTSNGDLRQRTITELNHPIFAQISSPENIKGWLVNRSALDFSGELSPELIVAIPKDELLYDYIHLKNQMYIVSLVLLILLIPITWFLANRISRPLQQVHASIEDVSEGNFDFRLPAIKSNDEVGDLVDALRTMRNSITDHIKELANATAAKERLESELEIARKIQMSMVPGAGNLKLQLPQYNIDARLLPAKAVGGDLYIVISLPDGRYFIAVGDVSDKGVPAALFMSQAVSLAKLLVPKIVSLSQAVSELNDQLSEDNDECMFITFFCAVLDPSNDSLTSVCAGHNPPVLMAKNGEVSFIEVNTGSPLGLFANGNYEESQIHFEKGDRLIIYTDGITEAFNERQQEFSDKKLLDTLKDSKNLTLIQEISDRLLLEVKNFAGKEPQSDDITLFILEKLHNG